MPIDLGAQPGSEQERREREETTRSFTTGEPDLNMFDQIFSDPKTTAAAKLESVLQLAQKYMSEEKDPQYKEVWQGIISQIQGPIEDIKGSQNE